MYVVGGVRRDGIYCFVVGEVITGRGSGGLLEDAQSKCVP